MYSKRHILRKFSKGGESSRLVFSEKFSKYTVNLNFLILKCILLKFFRKLIFLWNFSKKNIFFEKILKFFWKFFEIFFEKFLKFFFEIFLKIFSKFFFEIFFQNFFKFFKITLKKKKWKTNFLSIKFIQRQYKLKKND